MKSKKQTTFDFEDGRGPVAAHQWINPDKSLGGWVADENVEISIEIKAKLFVDIHVKFSGYFKTRILGGDFRGGTFRGGDFWGGDFRGGTFRGGDFWGGTFRGGDFWGGTFWGGDFWGGDFWGGTIKTNKDFIVFSCVGSRDDNLLVQFDSGEPLFTTGCQRRITITDFEKLNKKTHPKDRFGLEYKILIKTVRDIWEVRKNDKDS